MLVTEQDITSPAQSVTGSEHDGSEHDKARKTFAWLLLLAGVALGIYYRNPAVALLVGLFVRLAIGVNPVAASGKVSKLSLQSAIVLLGFTLGVDQLLGVSAEYGVTVAVFVLATLASGWILLRLFHGRGQGQGQGQGHSQEGTLLTAGTAICGGTAIATLAPLTGAKPHQFAVAMALVFLLNIVALFTFPYIGYWLGLSQETFGAWVALAIHDTSSVVATAAIYGDEAAQIATTVKLGRTLWLIPVAFAASLLYRQGEAKLRVPVFVLLFIAAAVLSSLVTLPGLVIASISWASKVLLVVALALIGLEINRQTLQHLSLRSVAFAVSLWLLAAPGALLLVLYF